METSDPNENPFPGLRPFESDENHLFFGRDGQTDELLRRLRQHHFLAVVGTSGSGKSSLVRAGLLPDIHGGFLVEAGSSWRVALFKPGNDPIGNLAGALGEPGGLGGGSDDATLGRIIETTLRRSANGLIEAMRQARVSGNLLVIVDQFEELFRFKKPLTASHPEDDAATLVKLLIEAAAQREVPIYVVLTMRSDYLGDCARFGRLPEAINEGLYLIPRMTRDQRREAITGPVAVGGGTIAPRLVNRLLNDMGDDPDQLPILQHALMRMWNCWKVDGACGQIDLEHYHQVGTMAGALCQQADEVFAAMTERDQFLTGKIFKRLTEKGADNREVRRPCVLQELMDLTGGTEAELQAVLDPFRQPGCSFLMPPAEKPLGPQSLIDISHESLIRGWTRLRAWVEDEAQAAEVYRRLAQTAQLHEEQKAGLWRDPDLQLALDWRKQNQPSLTWARRYHPDFERAEKFLNDSQARRDADAAEQQSQKNARRRLRHAIIAVLAVACALSWLLFSQAHSARKEAETAKETAVTQKTAAERAKKRAEEAEAMAIEREKTAEMEKRRAKDAEEIALTHERAARNAASRVRKQNRDDNDLIVSMAARLAELSTPEELSTWQSLRVSALGQLRRHQDAIRQYESILETDPLNSDAHFNLGYYYILDGRPAEAIAHTKLALAENPTVWTAYQNLAIALGAMGKYDEAAVALKQSRVMFQHTTTESTDSEIDPDIQQATGLTMLVIDQSSLRDVSLLELANLEAFRGGDAFEERRAEATAATLPTQAYLVAVNWVWYHFKTTPTGTTPKDYGGFAAQGAWWEKAGYRPRARHAYEQFQSIHQKKGENRYRTLADWVSLQLAKLQDEKLPEKQPDDVATLAMDAWDHENRNAFDEAQRCRDRMVELAPGNVGFVLERAVFLTRRAWTCANGSPEREKYFRAAKTDCDTVLEANPKAAVAYKFRAATNEELGTAQPGIIEADYRKALANNPEDGDAMVRLSKWIAKDRADEALALLERALKTNLNYQQLSDVYRQMAEIQKAGNRLKAALQSIETAIRIKSDNASFYDLRAEIALAGHQPPGEVTEALAAGYCKVADARLRDGVKAEAMNFYGKSFQLLAALRSAKDTGKLTRQIAETVTRISAVVERVAISSGLDRHGSREKVIQFWKDVIQAEPRPELLAFFQSELKRLSPAQ